MNPARHICRRVEFDPTTAPMAPADYVIRAILDGVDHLALEMERKWGVDRLRLLVPDELRARFDAQKDKLDAAIATNREAYVRAQAEGMKRAWKALDRAASEAGHAPLAPEVWECVLPETGEIVALVRTTAEAHLAARPDMRVFTLAEIGRLIEALGNTVLEVKGTFPGSEVTRVAKPEIDWARGDDIPF